MLPGTAESNPAAEYLIGLPPGQSSEESSVPPEEASLPEQFTPNTDAEADTNVDSGMTIESATEYLIGPAPAGGGGSGY